MEVTYIEVSSDDLDKIKELALMRADKEDEKNNYELTEECKTLIYNSCIKMFQKENIFGLLLTKQAKPTERERKRSFRLVFLFSIFHRWPLWKMPVCMTRGNF